MWATGGQNQEDDAVELIQITQLTEVARTIVVCRESHRNDGIRIFKASRGRDARYRRDLSQEQQTRLHPIQNEQE